MVGTLYCCIIIVGGGGGGGGGGGCGGVGIIICISFAFVMKDKEIEMLDM